MAATIAASDIQELAARTAGIQREHVDAVRAASRQLAADELEETSRA